MYLGMKVNALRRSLRSVKAESKTAHAHPAQTHLSDFDVLGSEQALVTSHKGSNGEGRRAQRRDGGRRKGGQTQ